MIDTINYRTLDYAEHHLFSWFVDKELELRFEPNADPAPQALRSLSTYPTSYPRSQTSRHTQPCKVSWTLATSCRPPTYLTPHATR